METFFVTGEIDKITNFEVIYPLVGIRRSNQVCGQININNIHSVNLHYLSFISVEINFYWNIHRMRVKMITVTATAVDGRLLWGHVMLEMHPNHKSFELQHILRHFKIISIFWGENIFFILVWMNTLWFIVINIDTVNYV